MLSPRRHLLFRSVRLSPETAVVTVAVLALVGASGAEAAPKRITGKLTVRGYDVIALANGRAKSVRAKPRFKLRPSTRRSVTLHLRAPDGTYAGPIVVGAQKRGRRAILGVRAGARLRQVRVKAGKGYAKAKPRRKWRDPTLWGRARKRAPRANGVNFGRVLSKPRRGEVPGDLDLDGVPNRLDIDDDGDLVLDNLDAGDRSRRARAAAEGRPVFGVRSVLDLDIASTANANAAGLTDAQSDAAMRFLGLLQMPIISPGDSELDCGGVRDPVNTDGWSGGLVYCTRGGTGTFQGPGPGPPPPFPDDFDPDGDGDGTLPVTLSDGFGDYTFLNHGADSTQIGTGDVLIQRVTTNGAVTEYPAALEYVFASVPALASYEDERGNDVAIDYPVEPPAADGTTPGGRGSRENGLPLSDGPDADDDVEVKLNFWRPQRRPIAGEECLNQNPPCTWIDIGGLLYAIAIADIGYGCQQKSLSENDPSLSADIPRDQYGDNPLDRGGFIDLSPDRRADPTKTLSFTVNLSECLRSPFEKPPNDPPPSQSFQSGETRGISIAAYPVAGPNSGEAAQVIWFERQ